MDSLLKDLESAADSLLVDLPVQDDPLDEDDAPCVVVERETVNPDNNNPLQLSGQSNTEVFLAYPSGFHWEDIEQVAGAFINALKEQAPATNITSIELGRGASGLRLVKLQIQTGTGLDLTPLPTDFSYTY